MTIESTLTAQTISGDGIVRTFPFTFKAWENQLRVLVTGPNGAEEDVTALCSILVHAETGGVATYPVSANLPALPAGCKLTVMRAMDFKQNTDLVTGSRYLSDVLEERLDKLTAQDQELRERVNRAVVVPVAGDTSPEELIGQLFDAADQTTDLAAQASAAATAAGLAAQDAAASAGAALASEAKAEYWAELAEDAVSGSLPLATPTHKGLAPAGGAAGQVYGVSADGTAYGFHDPDLPPAASESARGLVELATAEETTAGTDAERAVTPAALAGVVGPEAEVSGKTFTSAGAEAGATGFRLMDGTDLGALFGRLDSVENATSGSGAYVTGVSLAVNDKSVKLTQTRGAASYCGYCTYCGYCSYCSYCASNCAGYN